MSVRRVYQKAARTPGQAAELAAVRAKYQREKPSLEQALAENGYAEPVPLGALVELHHVLAQLRRERERQGLSLAEVAGRAGLDPAALSRLESGKNGNPTIATVSRVAAALGLVVTCAIKGA
ncbi:MAG: helix-turn-helix transcriptional regulator [Gemmataceae bacterium]|nr:helix-turn-helix transcriptional regulator [Gemmataceae bacterium]